MKRGYGSCPGTCGELVQGYLGKKEYISSYCINIFSKARISETGSNRYAKRTKSKSLKAVELVFERFEIDRREVENIKLEIYSGIPTGKGMASSTADIGASVMAALDFLGESLDTDEISKIVSKVEPTDSVFYREVCIFDPINGEKKESLGFLPYKKVLILEPDFKINTVKLRKDFSYYKNLRNNAQFTEKSFEMLKKGIRERDGELIRNACLNSALANESIKKTPFLKELVHIGEENSYGFLNISHTGSVVGIGIDEKTDLEKMIYDIKNSDVSKIYKKHMVRKIIGGGLKGGK